MNSDLKNAESFQNLKSTVLRKNVFKVCSMHHPPPKVVYAFVLIHGICLRASLQRDHRKLEESKILFTTERDCIESPTQARDIAARESESGECSGL